MHDAIYARSQMGMSLAFHIVFAAIGVAMPVLMVLAELRWRRTGDEDFLRLAKAWAKGTAIFFAVGAVSGTALSFELGLLFPGFMKLAGPVIGMPFSMEGFAFFTEAIFLGIYLYGWDRVSQRVHVFAGVIVALSGLASSAFVTLVNAWMNAPRGFDLDASGALTNLDPVRAMTTPFALHEILHMSLAAYMSTALAAAGIHAFLLRRDNTGPAAPRHRKALALCLALAIPCSLAQPLAGHYAGHEVAVYQPMKLAAMERHMHTEAYAPVTIGPVKIPWALSLLAFDDPKAVVQGLEDFPRADWPHPAVRVAWETMIIFGTMLGGFAAWGALRRLRKRAYDQSRLFLLATVVCAPLGFICLEAGWMVTELGRQPWVIYGVLRTVDAVTPMPGTIVPLAIFTALYLALAWVVVAVFRRQVKVLA